MADAPPHIAVCGVAPDTVSIMYYDTPTAPHAPDVSQVAQPGNEKRTATNRRVAHVQPRVGSRRAKAGNHAEIPAAILSPPLTPRVRPSYSAKVPPHKRKVQTGAYEMRQSRASENLSEKPPLSPRTLCVYLDSHIWPHVSLHAYPDATLAIISKVAPSEYTVEAQPGAIHLRSARLEERDALERELQLAQKTANDHKTEMDHAVDTLRRSLDRQAAAEERSRNRAAGLRENVQALNVQRLAIEKEEDDITARILELADNSKEHTRAINELKDAIRAADRRAQEHAMESGLLNSQMMEAAAKADSAEHELARLSQQVNDLSLRIAPLQPPASERRNMFRFPLAPRP